MPEVSLPDSGPAVPFDFRQSSQIPEVQLLAIRTLHEGFIRSLCESLTLSLGAQVSGEVAGLEQTSLEALAESISTPACLLCFSMQPQEEHTVLEVSTSLIAPILDCVLGGNGKIAFGLEREITDIEQAMLEGFFETVARELRKAWQPVAPIDFQFAGVETNAQTSQKLPATSGIILVAADLRIGENEGRLNVLIPALAAKALRQKSDSRPEPRKSISRDLEHAIQEKLAAGLNLELDCALVGSSIRLNDLLKLKPGDLIDTGIPSDGLASILVNGVPKFSGEITVEAGVQAVILRSAAGSAAEPFSGPAI